MPDQLPALLLVFGTNNPSFRVGYSRLSRCLAYKGVCPTSLKEAVRASGLELDTWVHSLVWSHILSVMLSDLRSQLPAEENTELEG